MRQPDASVGPGLQQLFAPRPGGQPAQAEPPVEELARLVAGSGLMARGPSSLPDARRLPFGWVLVVVKVPETRGDGVDWSGFALPRFPVLGAWKVLEDGALQPLEGGCPDTLAREHCLWVGRAGASPEGPTYFANVLAPTGSFGGRVTLARSDEGWALKRAEVTWVE